MSGGQWAAPRRLYFMDPPCVFCDERPAREGVLCDRCRTEDEPVDPDPWLGELGPIGGGA